MIIVGKYLVPSGYSAITLFPFILVRDKASKSDQVMMNHEHIHLRQQIELLILPFYLFYGIEFIVRFVGSRNWNQAYRSISFENEAFLNEKDLNYLKYRPFWNFLNYM